MELVGIELVVANHAVLIVVSENLSTSAGHTRIEAEREKKK